MHVRTKNFAVALSVFVVSTFGGGLRSSGQDGVEQSNLRARDVRKESWQPEGLTNEIARLVRLGASNVSATECDEDSVVSWQVHETYVLVFFQSADGRDCRHYVSRASESHTSLRFVHTVSMPSLLVQDSYSARVYFQGESFGVPDCTYSVRFSDARLEPGIGSSFSVKFSDHFVSIDSIERRELAGVGLSDREVLSLVPSQTQGARVVNVLPDERNRLASNPAAEVITWRRDVERPHARATLGVATLVGSCVFVARARDILSTDEASTWERLMELATSSRLESPRSISELRRLIN